MSATDKNFARIATGWKWLDQDIVDIWAREQETGRYCPLSRWLLKKKYLSARQIATIMRDMSIETQLSSLTSISHDFDAIGRYRIIDKIGQGGMGVVFRVRDSMLDRIVALKVLKDSLLTDDNAQKRFQHEAKLMGGLQHPNVVKIYDVGRQESVHYFAMEYIEGETLECTLAKDIPAFTLVTILIKVCEAVQYAHQRGVIHCGLKPANIMIDSDFEPRVMDFGLGKKIEDGIKFSRNGEIVGTLEYLAPEQAKGNMKAIDAQSDIYALGAILYRMLTGRPPFSGDIPYRILKQIVTREPRLPTKINGELPKALESICLKALEKDKSRRYRNASEMAEDLQAYLQGGSVSASPVTSFSRSWKWCQRHYIVSGIGWLLLLAVAALIGRIVVAKQKYITKINEQNLRSVAQTQKLGRQKKTLEQQIQKLVKQNSVLERQKIEIEEKRIAGLFSTSAMQMIVAAFYGKRHRNYPQLDKWRQQAAATMVDLAKLIAEPNQSKLSEVAGKQWQKLRDRQCLLQRFFDCLARYGSYPSESQGHRILRVADIAPDYARSFVGRKRKLMTAGHQSLGEVSLAPDANYLACYFYPNLYLWHKKTGALNLLHRHSFGEKLKKMSFSSDGSLLLWCGIKQALVWRVKDLKLIYSRQSPEIHKRINFFYGNLLLYLEHGAGPSVQTKIRFYELTTAGPRCQKWLNIPENFDSCAIGQFGDKIAILAKSELQVWQRNAGQGLVPTRCGFPWQSPPNTFAFYRPFALAVGTKGGEFIAGDWRQNRRLLQFRLPDAVEKIFYDKKNALHWIQTEKALFIYPALDGPVVNDDLISEVVHHLFPWQLYPGYFPVVDCAVSDNFSHIALLTCDLDILLFRLP